MTGFERPIPDSYPVKPRQVSPGGVSPGQVSPGGLWAGEYPGARLDDQARRKLGRLLAAGISLFLDLTEAGEYGLKPYAPFLEELAGPAGKAAVHRRMPIPDGGTPSGPEMARILDTLDAALEEGHTVYVHCWGGIGRTGTVVGCYLVRHGLSGAQALAEIARLRQGTPDGQRRSPENDAQERMVRSWPVGG